MRRNRHTVAASDGSLPVAARSTGRAGIDATQEINYRAVAETVAALPFEGYFCHEFRPSPGCDPLRPLAEAVELCDVWKRCLAAVETIPDAQLDHTTPGGKTVLTDLLLGISSHDLYHAGQIQLLKRLRQGSS